MVGMRSKLLMIGIKSKKIIESLSGVCVGGQQYIGQRSVLLPLLMKFGMKSKKIVEHVFGVKCESEQSFGGVRSVSLTPLWGGKMTSDENEHSERLRAHISDLRAIARRDARREAAANREERLDSDRRRDAERGLLDAERLRILEAERLGRGRPVITNSEGRLVSVEPAAPLSLRGLSSARAYLDESRSLAWLREGPEDAPTLESGAPIVMHPDNPNRDDDLGVWRPNSLHNQALNKGENMREREKKKLTAIEGITPLPWMRGKEITDGMTEKLMEELPQTHQKLDSRFLSAIEYVPDSLTIGDCVKFCDEQSHKYWGYYFRATGIQVSSFLLRTVLNPYVVVLRHVVENLNDESNPSFLGDDHLVRYLLGFFSTGSSRLLLGDVDSVMGTPVHLLGRGGNPRISTAQLGRITRVLFTELCTEVIAMRKTKRFVLQTYDLNKLDQRPDMLADYQGCAAFTGYLKLRYFICDSCDVDHLHCLTEYDTIFYADLLYGDYLGSAQRRPRKVSDSQAYDFCASFIDFLANGENSGTCGLFGQITRFILHTLEKSKTFPWSFPDPYYRYKAFKAIVANLNDPARALKEFNREEEVITENKMVIPAGVDPEEFLGARTHRLLLENIDNNFPYGSDFHAPDHGGKELFPEGIDQVLRKICGHVKAFCVKYDYSVVYKNSDRFGGCVLLVGKYHWMSTPYPHCAHNDAEELVRAIVDFNAWLCNFSPIADRYQLDELFRDIHCGELDGNGNQRDWDCYPPYHVFSRCLNVDGTGCLYLCGPILRDKSQHELVCFINDFYIKRRRDSSEIEALTFSELATLLLQWHLDVKKNRLPKGYPILAVNTKGHIGMAKMVNPSGYGVSGGTHNFSDGGIACLGTYTDQMFREFAGDRNDFMASQGLFTDAYLRAALGFNTGSLPDCTSFVNRVVDDSLYRRLELSHEFLHNPVLKDPYYCWGFMHDLTIASKTVADLLNICMRPEPLRSLDEGSSLPSWQFYRDKINALFMAIQHYSGPKFVFAQRVFLFLSHVVNRSTTIYGDIMIDHDDWNSVMPFYGPQTRRRPEQFFEEGGFCRDFFPQDELVDRACTFLKAVAYKRWNLTTKFSVDVELFDKIPPRDPVMTMGSRLERVPAAGEWRTQERNLKEAQWLMDTFRPFIKEAMESTRHIKGDEDE